MKKLLLMTGAAALLALVSIAEASARYRGGGVGVRGAGFSGGYRGAAFRTGAVGRYGYRGARIGYVGGARYVGRRVGGYYPYRYGYRRYAPYAVGLGVAAATAYSYDNCYRYNGWQWVNVCYGPYGYRY
jgi:hypothetical protein